MKILILNVGSSSVKYSVFDNDRKIFSGSIEDIGEGSRITHSGEKKRVNIATISEAVILIAAAIKKNKIPLDAIGHRVVHGGVLGKSMKITPTLLIKLKKTAELAPIHDFPEIKGIEICAKIFNKPQIAVFDTAFHQTIPESAYTYALPHKIAEKHSIRRYGFHGTSHKYVAIEACRELGRSMGRQRIITCHLGNGCSVTAIRNGKSVDTSMGFTPLEGLVMGTRCGDIDPAIITFLMKHEQYSSEDINHLLNHESGLLGISGITNNVRELLKSKERRARLALDVFVHRTRKYIGAYMAVLGGADMIVFTGGIGEKSAKLRKQILNGLEAFGVKLDSKKNTANNKVISESKSKVKVLVIPSNESLMMAREVIEIMS